MCISYIASSFHCHKCQLKFKVLLPPAKKQKTLACIRERQVHKLLTKVYSQKEVTAMKEYIIIILRAACKTKTH